jgi:hypothetical protein
MDGCPTVKFALIFGNGMCCLTTICQSSLPVNTLAMDVALTVTYRWGFRYGVRQHGDPVLVYWGIFHSNLGYVAPKLYYLWEHQYSNRFAN